MPSLAYASQNAHVENRIVRYTGCAPNPGFLLGRSGPIAQAQWFALFNDGTHEEIKPVSGKPRPDPDTAIRTKHVSVPPSLRGLAVPAYASQFTGGMRQVVQCEFSRGADTKFSYTAERTHGLLEFPFEHVSGADKASEAAARAKRKYFVIEISSAGVYAAPVEFGIDCCTAALVSRYMATREDVQNGAPPDAVAQLNLAWYHGSKQGGRNAPVQRVLSAEQVEPVLTQAGGAWYPGMGWAFSYSGRNVANVLNRVVFANGFYSYRTTLVRIRFAVAVAGQVPATIVRAGNVATVNAPGHDLIEGALATIQGANEADYNGAHVAYAVTSAGFKFNVSGNPASPATGSVKVASLANGATVSGSIAAAETGNVLFKFGGGGTLWFPEAPGRWRGVYPSPNSANVSGPVHVFYDGEEEIVTRWSNAQSSVEEVHVYNPRSSYNWSGNAGGTHSYGESEPGEVRFVCQHHTCEERANTPVLSGSGSIVSAHTLGEHGFSGATVQGFTRFKGTAQTTATGPLTEHTEIYSNFYSLCESCYVTNANGTIRTTGRATIEAKSWTQDTSMTRTEGTEAASGGSYAVMLYEDREAIVTFSQQSQRYAYQQSVSRNWQVVRRAQRMIDGDGPFTDWDMPSYTFGGWYGPTHLPDSETKSITGAANIRAAGGFNQFRTLTFDEQGNIGSDIFAPFTTFTQAHQVADSGLWFMRGGLFYPDPTLTPALQAGNAVYRFDDEEGAVLEGGFVRPEGVTLVAFVGKV